MNENIKTLLGDILDWMNDNDYECGEQGAKIYERISEALKNKDFAKLAFPQSEVIPEASDIKYRKS